MSLWVVQRFSAALIHLSKDVIPSDFSREGSYVSWRNQCSIQELQIP
jgi:hypothetical protein